MSVCEEEEFPASSRLSMKSDRSNDHPPEFSNEPKPSHTKRQRAEFPASSCLSMKSDRSNDHPPDFSKEPKPSDTRRRRAESAASSCLSMKSDRSNDHPPYFSKEPKPSDTKRRRAESVASSCLSEESDWSKRRPPDFSKEPEPSDTKRQRAQFPISSRLSMKSDWSKIRPPNFSIEPKPSDTNIRRAKFPASSCQSMKSDWSNDHPPDFSKEPEPSDKKIDGRVFKTSRNKTFVSDVRLVPNTADTEPDSKRMKTSAIFTPEMQMESSQISYRFSCTGPGVFQCAETGLVFVMTQGAELLYRIVQWDESRLKPSKKAAGPLYDIKCSEDAAVCQLHFPHCETESALSIDGLLSVVHFTDDGMDILEPLQITDTHVVVEVPHLSLFGLISDPVKRWLSLPVKGQVLVFLQLPKRGPPTLDVHLLQKNVPPSQVAAQKKKAEYIEIPANCSLIIGRSYSVHCEPEGLKIQPECENFDPDFGPHFHPTFQVFLETNPDVVALTVQDQNETEVWKRDVYLKDPRRDTKQRVQRRRVQRRRVQRRRVQPWRVHRQRVQPQNSSSVRTQLIQGLSDVTVDQLLDRLYDQHVISEEEKDVIRAQTGANKVRQLTDWVHRKGPKAVSLLKAALQEVDPFLFRNLNLT